MALTRIVAVLIGVTILFSGTLANTNDWLGPSDKTKELVDVPCDFDTVDIKDLPAERFFSEYFNTKPVVIRGLLDNWAARKEWTRAYFQAQEATVHAGSSNGITSNDGSGPETFTLRDFLSKHPENSTDEEPLYIFDRTHSNQKTSNLFTAIPELRKHFSVPPFFANWEYVSQFFLLGQDGSAVGFHRHPDAWNALVHGQKRWFVYPPDWTPSRESMENFPNISTMSHTQWMTHVLPTLTGDDVPKQCIQYPDEVLYIPGLHAHATISIGETVGVAYQLSNGLTYSGGGPKAFSGYLHLMGTTLKKYGRCEEAIKFLEDYATENKDEAHLSLAECLLKIGEDDLARQVYAHGVRTAPLDTEVWIGYAQALAAKSGLTKAATDAYSVAKAMLMRQKMMLQERIEEMQAKDGKKGKGGQSPGKKKEKKENAQPARDAKEDL